MGAEYSFDIKSGFSIAPAFSLHNNFDIASVAAQLTANSLFENDIIYHLGYKFDVVLEWYFWRFRRQKWFIVFGQILKISAIVSSSAKVLDVKNL